LELTAAGCLTFCMPSTDTFEYTSGFANQTCIARLHASAEVRPNPARLLYSVAAHSRLALQERRAAKRGGGKQLRLDDKPAGAVRYGLGSRIWIPRL
jgi:hypothetical protein